MTDRPDWRRMDPGERDRLLIDYCQKGMSASKIAARFSGCSRSAVIALIHRRKAKGVPVQLPRTPPLPHRNYNLVAKRKRKPPTVPALAVPASVRLVRDPEIILPDVPPCNLLDLAPGHCKFAVSAFHAREHLFCNQLQESGSVYCAKHTRIAFHPPQYRTKEKRYERKSNGWA